ncbi:hypothetical protein TeGR_g1881 [Tetraparma gracilis]|uniref:Pentapeptide repeat-containing protein n=1 Tax=Tetraparma gracilis TaxID=2962635 RepID=A0ABQ6MCQ5_9STRA|nr:hypothetical protein TeGR_g1881 [Tetraparma gracilis]
MLRPVLLLLLLLPSLSLRLPSPFSKPPSAPLPAPPLPPLAAPPLAFLAAPLLCLSLLSPPALADGSTGTFKLPPIDTSAKNRCSFSSSNIGQANAARDKLYDLRECDMSSQPARGYDLSGVLMEGTNARGADFTEAQFSKGYLHTSDFREATFVNAVVDRASFTGSDLRQAVFRNAVLTGTSFDGANLEGADFSDAYIGDFDQKALCKNPSLKGSNEKTGEDSRFSAGCK